MPKPKTGLPSFASDPIYSNAVAAANADFQATQGNILQNISHGFLQLGNPEFAKAWYANNWLRTKGTPGHPGFVNHGTQPAWFHGKKAHELTPYERAQLKAIGAAGDPKTGTGVFAQLGRQYGLQQEALNNELNAANLFYSGARGKQLGQLGREFELNKANALYGGQQQLDTQMTSLTGAQNERRKALADAAQAAYIRMLAQRLGGG